MQKLAIAYQFNLLYDCFIVSFTLPLLGYTFDLDPTFT